MLYLHLTFLERQLRHAAVRRSGLACTGGLTIVMQLKQSPQADVWPELVRPPRCVPTTIHGEAGVRLGISGYGPGFLSHAHPSVTAV